MQKKPGGDSPPGFLLIQVRADDSNDLRRPRWEL